MMLNREHEQLYATNVFQKNEIRTEVKFRCDPLLSHCARPHPSIITEVRPFAIARSFVSLIRMKECEFRSHKESYAPLMRSILHHRLPNHSETKFQSHVRVFCGKFSPDGELFISATQQGDLRVYDTVGGQLALRCAESARDVGWAVLDVELCSRGSDGDAGFVVYSSWSDCIYMFPLARASNASPAACEEHTPLALRPDNRRFCVFSLACSPNHTDLLCGHASLNTHITEQVTLLPSRPQLRAIFACSSDSGEFYVYNFERGERTYMVRAHEDDVNTVAFASSTNRDIFYTGSDDGLVKAWDFRTLWEQSPEPVAVFAGHRDGVAFVDSKGDARYLISNSKDQSIKLWDLRCTASHEAIEATRHAVSSQNWDYRWQSPPRFLLRAPPLPGDCSVNTYRGAHTLLSTLIRARFSPLELTGQRYLYVGSATGEIVLYDLLTARVVTRLNNSAHVNCVRDVSWHPHENRIISSSFDGMINEWTYRAEDEDEDCDANSMALAPKSRVARRRACGSVGGARQQKQRRSGRGASTAGPSISPPSDIEATNANASATAASLLDAGRATASTARPFAGLGSGSGSGSGESSEAESPGRNLFRLLFRVTSTAAGSQGSPAAGSTPRLPSLRQLLEADNSAGDINTDVSSPPSQPDSNGEAPDTEQRDWYEDPSFR